MKFQGYSAFSLFDLDIHENRVYHLRCFELPKRRRIALSFLFLITFHAYLLAYYKAIFSLLHGAAVPIQDVLLHLQIF